MELHAFFLLLFRWYAIRMEAFIIGPPSPATSPNNDKRKLNLHVKQRTMLLLDYQTVFSSFEKQQKP